MYFNDINSLNFIKTRDNSMLLKLLFDHFHIMTTVETFMLKKLKDVILNPETVYFKLFIFEILCIVTNTHVPILLAGLTRQRRPRLFVQKFPTPFLTSSLKKGLSLMNAYIKQKYY